jgi:hypothetical protein
MSHHPIRHRRDLMRVLAMSFALSHKLEVTCDAALAATAVSEGPSEQEVNDVTQ